MCCASTDETYTLKRFAMGHNTSTPGHAKLSARGKNEEEVVEMGQGLRYKHEKKNIMSECMCVFLPRSCSEPPPTH